MVKTYYNYHCQQNAGHIASSQCNFDYHPHTKLIYAGTNQYVAIINPRTGRVEQYLSKKHKNVTVRYVKLAPTQPRLAVGYEDGEVVIFSTETKQIELSLDAHKATVTCLRFSEDSTVLLSAGGDNRIIIWDLISEECEIIKDAHKASITQIELVQVYNKILCRNEELILSAGKDGMFKVWSYANRQLLEAVASLTNEVWSFAFNKFDNLVYIGTNKQEIVIVSLEPTPDSTHEYLTRYAHVVARFKRNSFARPLQMVLKASLLYLLNSDKVLESYRILDDKEFMKRKKRLLQRKKARDSNPQKEERQEMEIEEEEVKPALDRVDQEIRLKLEKIRPITIAQKVFNMHLEEGKIFINNGRDILELSSEAALTQSLGLTTNLDLAHPYLLHQSKQEVSIFESNSMSLMYKIEDEAEAAVLYKGYLLYLTADEIVVWNLAEDCEVLRKKGSYSHIYASDYGLILWKEAVYSLYVFGYNKKKELDVVKAYDGFVSEKIIQASYLNKEKYVLCTQDANVLIMHRDSHKVHLKMYGHKLPINSFDISSDEQLLLTGSSDKDIKLWGLDYGNCVKSIFAHSEPVTVVRFVKDTHYFFSGSKDGHIKYWDGDTYQLILDFEECLAEVRSIVISPAGDYLIAGGNDGGFRVWRQTSQQTYYAEQLEKRNDKMIIEDYANNKLKENQEKTTYSDLKNGEEIIECLSNNDTPHQLLKLLKEISPSKLKASLSFLHSMHRLKLVRYLEYFLARKAEVDTVWRVCEALDLEVDLSERLRTEWEETRELVKVNIEGMKLIHKSITESKEFGL